MRRHPPHHLSPARQIARRGKPEASLSRSKSSQRRSDQARKPVNSEQDSCAWTAPGAGSLISDAPDARPPRPSACAIQQCATFGARRAPRGDRARGAVRPVTVCQRSLKALRSRSRSWATSTSIDPASAARQFDLFRTTISSPPDRPTCLERPGRCGHRRPARRRDRASVFSEPPLPGSHELNAAASSSPSRSRRWSHPAHRAACRALLPACCPPALTSRQAVGSLMFVPPEALPPVACCSEPPTYFALNAPFDRTASRRCSILNWSSGSPSVAGVDCAPPPQPRSRQKPAGQDPQQAGRLVMTPAAMLVSSRNASPFRAILLLSGGGPS
jgi:hypothetical protein